MINAIIIDDEDHCISRLKTLLNDYCAGQVNILESYTDIDSGFDAILLYKPDVVFLDIQIHDATGFDLLKRFESPTFDVVFTTAFEQFAIRAFKFSAIDYLLKPIDPDDLVDTMSRLKARKLKNDIPENFNLLLENIKNMQQQNKKITIPTVNGLMFLPVQDIIRCKSDVNYTTIYLKDKKSFMVAKTLKEFEALLVQYNFFRVHNSHLVNLAYIKNYSKGKGGYLQLEDNSEIEVSTRRKEEFLKKLASM